MILQFWRSEAQYGSHWAKIKVLAGYISSGSFRGVIFALSSFYMPPAFLGLLSFLHLECQKLLAVTSALVITLLSLTLTSLPAFLLYKNACHYVGPCRIGTFQNNHLSKLFFFFFKDETEIVY